MPDDPLSPQRPDHGRSLLYNNIVSFDGNKPASSSRFLARLLQSLFLYICPLYTQLIPFLHLKFLLERLLHGLQPGHFSRVAGPRVDDEERARRQGCIDLRDV